MARLLCPNCTSADLRWHLVSQVGPYAIPLDGRLKLNDVVIVGVLACEECSETVQTISHSQAEEMLNAD